MPNPKIPVVTGGHNPQSFFKHEAKTTGPEILKHLGCRGKFVSSSERARKEVVGRAFHVGLVAKYVLKEA